MTGVLVCIVGPSGAGKDTLIDGARRALAGDDRFVFARRIVTRESSAAEDHDTVSPADFERLAAQDSFALAWEAHDLHYALPGALRDDISAGRIVVCNISRQAVAEACHRFDAVITILITAPAEILAGRLMARGRENDAARDRRVRREDSMPAMMADFTISNVGEVEANIARLGGLLLGIAQGRNYESLGCWAP